MFGILAAMLSPDILIAAVFAGWRGSLKLAAALLVGVLVLHEFLLSATQTLNRSDSVIIASAISAALAFIVIAGLAYLTRKRLNAW